MTKEKKPEKKPTDEALATLLLDRQERQQRCAEAIDAVLKEERCTLSAPIQITPDGRVIAPEIKVMPLD